VRSAILIYCFLITSIPKKNAHRSTSKTCWFSTPTLYSIWIQSILEVLLIISRPCAHVPFVQECQESRLSGAATGAVCHGWADHDARLLVPVWSMCYHATTFHICQNICMHWAYRHSTLIRENSEQCPRSLTSQVRFPPLHKNASYFARSWTTSIHHQRSIFMLIHVLSSWAALDNRSGTPLL